MGPEKRMGEDRTRRALIGQGLAVGFCPSLGGAPWQSDAAQQPPQAFASSERKRNRLTAAVRIGDGLPLTFAIDTAANGSVIASDLLGLTPHRRTGPVVMHTLVAAETVETIRVSRFRSGVLDKRNVRLAVGDREGLEGLDGLLGSELLLGRRLVLDFKRRVEARIARSQIRSPSRLLVPEPGARLIAPIERRFSSLLMIPARLGGADATAIIDSGASMTMMNEAGALAGGVRPLATSEGVTVVSIQSPTGRTTPARLGLLPALGFADARIGRLPVLVGDFHTFSQWGLAGQPALLLGVDVLGLFESVSIDLRLREFIVTL